MLYFKEADHSSIRALLARYGCELVVCKDNEPILGSFWGDSEAGLKGRCLYVRGDTPVHSLMHEFCHYICMDDERRQHLHTDAAGDYNEENGVCYLQIVLADELHGFDANAMMRDMDAWGYSFRLGSAKAWFNNDAEDARDWLFRHHCLLGDGTASFKLRML